MNPERSRHRRAQPYPEWTASLSFTLAVVLIGVWLFGLLSAYTLGGFIDLLLVFALVAILFSFASGKRTL